MMYKYLQILEKQTNDCVGVVIFPVFAIGFVAIQFFALYVCIKMHESMSVVSLGFFFLCYVDASALQYTILTTGSRIFVLSSEMLLSLRDISARNHTSREMRKTLKAFLPLQIKFGVNFVDNATPLVVQDMCIRQLTSSLLVTN